MKYLKFLILLVPVYFIQSYLSFSKEVIDIICLSAIGLCVLIFNLAIFYVMFLLFRGSLRWVGRQLNYRE